LHIFAPNQIEEEGNKMIFFFVFGTKFEQLCLQKGTFDFFLSTELLSNFLRNCGQLFGKSLATCGKP